jgi:hypothetical protein
MLNLSYTKSVSLTEQLHRIDELRKELLLLPLSPVDELGFQWEAQLNLIHYLLGFGGILVEKDQIKSYLSPMGNRNPHPHQMLIESYKRAYDYLYHHWLVSPKPVTTEALVDFYRETYGTVPQLTGDNSLNTSLRYIQVNPEHPVIQAALAQILILTLSPFGEYNEQFAQLVLLLFLYKYGYDMRRLPVYVSFFYRDIVTYKDMVIQTSRLQNVTAWLEYVSRAVIDELQKTVTRLKSPREQAGREADSFNLNERQHAIIALFNQPGIRVSNKMVQRKFKVSQITASRDLAKLTKLGVVFPIGKGRSTYYTKV